MEIESAIIAPDIHAPSQIHRQEMLVQKHEWIMDGDLGGPTMSSKSVYVRLTQVFFLDFSVADVPGERYDDLGNDSISGRGSFGIDATAVHSIAQHFAEHTRSANLHVLRTPKALKAFLEEWGPS